MVWRRPNSLPTGQVWRRFKGKDRDGEPGKMYQVRDLKQEDIERSLDLMQETFLRDEPVTKLLDVKSDPVSVASIRKNWENFLTQDISVACYTEVNGLPDELVGFNFILVKSKDDEEEEFPNTAGSAWGKLYRTLLEAENRVDVFKHYNVDAYLTSSGLTVLPGHRGQKIGEHIVKAREPLCKALGIQASATVFTAKSSQVLAKNCNYEVLTEMPYTDMLVHGIDLRGCETTSAKVMGIKFDFSKD